MFQVSLFYITLITNNYSCSAKLANACTIVDATNELVFSFTRLKNVCIHIKYIFINNISISLNIYFIKINFFNVIQLYILIFIKQLINIFTFNK